MSCGDYVSYWGSIASMIAIPLTLITILIASSIADYVKESRLTKRMSSIVAKIRESEKSGNIEHVKADLYVLLAAIETNYGWFYIILSKRIRKLYFAVRKQRKSDTPNIRLIEGLLLNFKKIHAEAET